MSKLIFIIFFILLIYNGCNKYYVSGKHNNILIIKNDEAVDCVEKTKTSEANSSTNAKVDDISKDVQVLKKEFNNVEGDLKKVEMKTEIVGKKVLGDSTNNIINDK